VDRDTRLTEMGITTLLIHSLVGRLHCYFIGVVLPLRPILLAGSSCNMAYFWVNLEIIGHKIHLSFLDIGLRFLMCSFYFLRCV